MWRPLKKFFLFFGILASILFFWMALGLPLLIDKLLIKSDKPMESEFIICLTGGINGDLLPIEDGWHRIYTAVELYFDGYGKKIVFTGGGTGKISEAEIYAESARWLGCPANVILVEPNASKTADHPKRLLDMRIPHLGQKTALNIVTTSLHSRRAALCFKKSGFNNFRIINKYSAIYIKEPEKVRILKNTSIKEFRPSGKKYDDIINRIKTRSSYFFSTIRELAAILVYKIRGFI